MINVLFLRLRSTVPFAVALSWFLFTLWILGTPFIERDQPILAFIPDKYYAVLGPLLLSCIFGSAALVVLGYLLTFER
jgi:hypothetical protein